MVPLHLAYAWGPGGETQWVTRIPEKGSDDWGFKAYGTPMEVAMPLTGVEVRRFKSAMKKLGIKADSAYVGEYGLTTWARQMRPDTR